MSQIITMRAESDTRMCAVATTTTGNLSQLLSSATGDYSRAKNPAMLKLFKLCECKSSDKKTVISCYLHRSGPHMVRTDTKLHSPVSEIDNIRAIKLDCRHRQRLSLFTENRRIAIRYTLRLESADQTYTDGNKLIKAGGRYPIIKSAR